MCEISQNTTPMRVMVLDADEAARSRVASELQRQGIEVTVLEDTNQAMVQLHLGRHEVLIVDMPFEDPQALRVLLNIRQTAPVLQIILHTSHSSFEMARHALNLGIFAYVEKSDDLQELMTTVHRAIHQYDAMALHRSEMRFATIINDMSDMVIRYLPDGSISFANRVFLDVFGLSTMDVSGRLVYEFVEATQREKLSDMLSRFTPHNTVVSMDVQMQLPTGRDATWFRWTNRAIYDEQQQLQEIQSALHDITDVVYSERYLLSRVAQSSAQLNQTHQRLAEEIANHQVAQSRIQQRESELAHAARLNIMGEMASSIAHELNQPLAAIANYTRGCVKRLERMPDIPPAIVHAMEAAAKQSDRAGHILRRLRDLVQKRSTYHQPVHMQGILSDVIELLEPSIAREGITLVVDNQLDQHLVNVDSIQIQQVLINFIRNAMDAMKPVQRERNQIVVHIGEADHGQIRVEVRDQGHGLGEMDPNHLFDMFVTTRSEGMGMGLAICRTIIESHGGQCHGTNRPEGGAVFSFTLPLCRDGLMSENSLGQAMVE